MGMFMVFVMLYNGVGFGGNIFLFWLIEVCMLGIWFIGIVWGRVFVFIWLGNGVCGWFLVMIVVVVVGFVLFSM